MYQIALGDSSSYLVIEGANVAAPFKHAVPNFVFSADPTLHETIDLHLSGTPAQISASLAVLELIIHRAKAYASAAYPSPQFLRFQLVAGGDYFNTPVSNLFLSAKPNAYKTHQTGSSILTLHYTRPNYFDGPQVELPLTGKSGTDVTGGLDLLNHYDGHANHGNYALVKKTQFTTELPAPLRLEIKNTYATGLLQDIFIGAYHHPTHDSLIPFYGPATSISGGTYHNDVTAIGEGFRRFCWSATTWTNITTKPSNSANVNILDGRTYRPFVHFHNAFAYTDLYFKIKLQRGTDVLFSGESVYADPDHQYLFLPPVQIPPTQLMREVLPHEVDLVLYGQHDTAAAYTVDIDMLMLLPLDVSTNFLGFYGMGQNDLLVEDNFRLLHNVNYVTGGLETVAHVRQGGPLTLWPSSNNFLFFIFANVSDQVDIMRTVTIKAYYRHRKRLL